MVRRAWFRSVAALGVLVTAACARATDPTPPAADFEAKLVELATANKLFGKPDSKPLRALFAARFEQQFGATIQKAYGDDYSALTAWLNDNPDVKEEFYTALHEELDRLPQ